MRKDLHWNMNNVTVNQMNEHVYRINEKDENGLNVDCYLVLGNQKAALIDTLQEEENLYDIVKEITSLPLIVLLTHAHPDHAGKACQKLIAKQVPVYMQKEDQSLLDLFVNGEWKNEITLIEGNEVFDLGEYTLKTLRVPGHTKGSLVFLNEEHEEVFTDDAIGSGGFWMQLDHCLPLHEYKKNVERLYDILHSYTHLQLFFGHSEQSNGIQNIQYIKDNMEATDKIIQGELTSPVKTMCVGGSEIPYCSISYGLIYDYCYNPENL